IHKMPVTPTVDTLSFFVVYMSAHIEPRSVSAYLSGISNKLEPYFPEVRANRSSYLVKRTLAGCMKLHSKPVKRKLPLSRNHVLTAITSLTPSSTHDDILFVAMLCTGFAGLMRLGELAVPDDRNIRDYRKCSLRSSVIGIDGGYGLDLPYHKGDRFFEGNRIRIVRRGTFKPAPVFERYVASRDNVSRMNPYLWITSKNTVPTRSWFMARLRQLEPNTQFAGQSMRAGGATAMAEDGSPPHLIQ
ncbi:hypothetical protein BDZ89DRAFT_928871, partial [Hymenopellis radicata]